MCVENAMPLSLKSDTFAALKEDFDSVLTRTIANMEMRCAREATINLKVSISLDKTEDVKNGGSRPVTIPSFKHDISSVMQVKDKKSGALTGDYELVWDDDEGNYVIRRIDDGQTIMRDDIVDADYDESVRQEVKLLNHSEELLVERNSADEGKDVPSDGQDEDNYEYDGNDEEYDNDDEYHYDEPGDGI